MFAQNKKLFKIFLFEFFELKKFWDLRENKKLSSTKRIFFFSFEKCE